VREQKQRGGARVVIAGSGATNVATGVPVLDHLLTVMAHHAGFDLALEVAPGGADEEIGDAGRALGLALASAIVPADEALAHVALETSGRPLVVSNVDLSDARVAGLDTDLAARFLRELAEGAGLTLHVRLIEGHDTRHVLDAIFKALGVALAQAYSPRKRKEAVDG
jgi:imidazoleglycerol-phosphate dehydratase